jgi:hypothetical protein
VTANKNRIWGVGTALTAVALAAGLVLAATAAAHVERASYWPNPAPDTTITPAAGGKGPDYRPLSRVLGPDADSTRVVCKSYSLHRLRDSLADARANGYKLRPLGRRMHVSEARAQWILSLNQELFRMCSYHSIQDAVNDSGNNDRVVIMPGIYTEPKSRAAPTDDPKCDQYEINNDQSQAGAVSYAYQVHCPNDQNLIAVIGRKEGGAAPQPPLQDRHGIPNVGRCIRCNLQMEGSGTKPNDVVIDAGRVASGNGAPIGAVKDVGIKVDRADGFYLRNLTIRHAGEHGVYPHEVDGYVLSRLKLFYSGEYGTLTFASDHGLTDQCEAKGHGDAGVYPGGAPDTGVERDKSYYPRRRLNQRITHCDLHHNNIGYSGTMGNATHVDHNNFYGNTTGLTTDSFFAGGHPGFPTDSPQYDHNNFFNNNFNDYRQGSDVESRVGVPIGTGILVAGGNDAEIRDNRIYGNYRNGTMLLAVPDAVACDPSNGCTPQNVSSTSNRNRTHDNILGIAPGGASRPNGNDFWWDQFAGNTGNCWYDNTTSTGDPPTSDPPSPLLPSDCATSVGTGRPDKEAYLADCALNGPDGPPCDWSTPPSKP